MSPDATELPDVVNLAERGRSLLDTADRATSGRAAANLVPGAGRVLTQTLLALTAGSVLADHTAPGSATLHVLEGSGVLTVDDDELELVAGQWVPIPAAVHGVRATEDLVCLLTVARSIPDQRDPDE